MKVAQTMAWCAAMALMLAACSADQHPGATSAAPSAPPAPSAQPAPNATGAAKPAGGAGAKCAALGGHCVNKLAMVACASTPAADCADGEDCCVMAGAQPH